jgi:hypothetical protein
MAKKEEKYRWSYPSDWLESRLKEYTEQGQSDAITNLYNTATALASKLSSDEIQDLFQSEMDADGYFDPLPIHSQRRFADSRSACGADEGETTLYDEEVTCEECREGLLLDEEA